MQAIEKHERGPTVHGCEPHARHDQRPQRHDEADVGQALAGVEVAPVGSEPPRQGTYRPAPEPGAVAPVDPCRLAGEGPRGPGAEGQPERRQPDEHPPRPPVELDVGHAGRPGEDAGVTLLPFQSHHPVPTRTKVTR